MTTGISASTAQTMTAGDVDQIFSSQKAAYSPASATSLQTRLNH